jgi:RNA polymerase sigma factor (sigma-70 family)
VIDVSEHMGLAYDYARKHARRCRHLDVDDLVQAACLGLLRAARDYDPARAAWSTYATWWMRAFVNRELQNHERTIRVPVHAQESGVCRGVPTSSLDAPLGAEDGRTWHDRMAADDAEPRDVLAEARLAKAIEALPERQRRVLRGRLWGDRTLAEVGAEWGVSRERVRQLESDALDALALAFAAQ